MSTNDRELLEMAAKAGYGFSQPAWAAAPDGTPVVFELFGKPWNPLEDDGDSQRLAVKRRYTVRIAQHEIVVWSEEYECLVSIPAKEHEDHDAAMRRAITEAAAEEGRRMP